MVFGAGYAGGTDTNLGNYVYVLDFEPSPETFADPITGTTAPQFDGGNVIKIVTVTPDATTDIPNGVTAHMSVVTPDGAPVPVGKESLAYYGGIAYFPDLQGQVWKLPYLPLQVREVGDTTIVSKGFFTDWYWGTIRRHYRHVGCYTIRNISCCIRCYSDNLNNITTIKLWGSGSCNGISKGFRGRFKVKNIYIIT